MRYEDRRNKTYLKKILEKEIEKRLRDGIKKTGGICYKWVSPGNSGVSDRIVILRSGELIFVELKTDSNTTKPNQKIQIQKLRDLNQRVTVLYGLSGVDNFLGLIKRHRLDLIENEMR